MSHVRIPCLASLVILATAVAAPARADTDSCRSVEVAPRGGTLPANTPALLVGSFESDAGDVTAGLQPNAFTLWRDDALIDVEMRERADGFFEAHLLEDLEPGETYDVQTQAEACENGCYSFIAGPPSPLPTVAGTLDVVESVVQGGADDFPFEAYARLRFTPSEALEPFLSVARISLEGAVPDADRVARNWAARPEFAVTSKCSQTWRHRPLVRVVVDLPGIDDRLRTAPLLLDLNCAQLPARLRHAPSLNGTLGTTTTCLRALPRGDPGPSIYPSPPESDAADEHDDVAAFTTCSAARRAPRRAPHPRALALGLGLGLCLGLARRRRRAR